MDELDQLIENSIGSDDDDDFAPENPDGSPPDSDGTDDGAGQDVFEVDAGDPTLADSGSQEDSLPDDPDATVDPPAPDPRDSQLEQLRLTNERQQAMLRAIVENSQKEAQRLKAQKEEDEYKQKLAEWDEMDPDEARSEQVRYVADMARQRQQALIDENNQLKQSILSQQEAESRMEVINYLKDTYKLTELEVANMSDYPDPVLMERYAERQMQARQNQTKAAREAKRQELASNPALRVGETGGSTPPPPKPVFDNLDDFVDDLFR